MPDEVVEFYYSEAQRTLASVVSTLRYPSRTYTIDIDVALMNIDT